MPPSNGPTRKGTSERATDRSFVIRVCLQTIASASIATLWIALFSAKAYAPEPAHLHGPDVEHDGSAYFPAPRPPVWIGTFDTTFGVMQLGQTRGTYSFNKGAIWITGFAGKVRYGWWVQSASMHKCANGGYYGRLVFEFSELGFTGKYGYCTDPPNAGSWNGRRRP